MVGGHRGRCCRGARARGADTWRHQFICAYFLILSIYFSLSFHNFKDLGKKNWYKNPMKCKYKLRCIMCVLERDETINHVVLDIIVLK